MNRPEYVPRNPVAENLDSVFETRFLTVQPYLHKVCMIYMYMYIWTVSHSTVSLVPSCTPSERGRASGDRGQYFGQDDVLCAKYLKNFKTTLYNNKNIQFSYLYLLKLPPYCHTLATTTKSQQITTDNGRNTRHLVWFSYLYNIQLSLSLTLLMTFYMTQYQRIYW